MFFLAANRAQSRLSVPGIQYEAENEPNGEITQGFYGATAGTDLKEHVLFYIGLLHFFQCVTQLLQSVAMDTACTV